MDPITNAQRLAAAQFGDAPKELALTVDLALAALKEDSMGEALNELRRADALVEKHALTEWEAEVMATWAVFYFQTGEEQKMYHAIREAQKREPDNKRIAALRKVLKGE